MFVSVGTGCFDGVDVHFDRAPPLLFNISRVDFTRVGQIDCQSVAEGWSEPWPTVGVSSGMCSSRNRGLISVLGSVVVVVQCDRVDSTVCLWGWSIRVFMYC